MSSKYPLKKIFSEAHFEAANSTDVEVGGLAYDSRLIKKGDLFFAMKGVHVDGHDFLAQVKAQGAVAAIVEREVASPPLPVYKAPDILALMSKISDIFFEHPSGKIPVLGITGTNGKTTATYLIENILRRAGHLCGVLGTINYRLGSESQPAPNTTPFSIDVQRFLAQAVRQRAQAVAMEVSSHALELHRVDDVKFAVGVFTNLTQDHLDFHKTMENYFAAKAKLFQRKEKVKAVVNVDDAYGQRLAEKNKAALTYGVNSSAALRASDITCNLEGIHFTLTFPSGRRAAMANNLLGLHNVYNCLSAAGGALALGEEESVVINGLNQSQSIPGRLERVDEGQKFIVAIDYAHTHDALSQVLTTLRNTGPRRLICIFGAGGDRDKTKRPKMGEVSTRLADYSYITSDNPRSEDPKEILKDVEAGILKEGRKNYVLIEDRKEAIRQAIQAAREGDVVLIAGKGHETYQIYGNTKIHFSDFEVAREMLKSCI